MPIPAAPAKGVVEPRHDLTPLEIDAIEDCLYEYNHAATGRDDGQRLRFTIRDEDGRTAAIAAGCTWAGASEIKRVWGQEAFRGQGYGRALLDAMVAEPQRRGVSCVWVSSYAFQAPGFYERAGFKRIAELDDWPEGRVNGSAASSANACMPMV